MIFEYWEFLILAYNAHFSNLKCVFIMLEGMFIVSS